MNRLPHPWHAGPLQSAIEVPGVTDVLVNGPDDVWIDRGAGLERAAVRFASVGEVRELAVRLASLGGRRLDDASPLVDARLPDGTRLHAALPPVVDGCATISLRTVRTRALSLDDLVLNGALAPRIAVVLEALVAVRASILVTGATGSGKTTLLASLLSLVDPGERIIVIEEAGEVNPDHPHVVRLVERRVNVDGAGEVSLARLVREALRMRPDRFVLGECRGSEVRDVLTAFNTGHRGGMATLHANAPADVPARFAALGALAGMDRRATDLHAAAAFDAVVHLEKTAAGRRVTEVAVLRAREGWRREEALRVEAALMAGPDGEVSEGSAWGELKAVLGWDETRERPVELGMAA
ncbi:MAG: TadA family conjugal transfer-associated ATPase [Demequinaceae bacterium]|nr:TadA family conjugal transfer-associated ATPase [Demequinaceae bacterium]